VLAAVGVFGAVGYAVCLRTREIGLRQALGAGPAAIVGAVLGELAVVLVGGAAAGSLGAMALSRFLRGSLHGVGPGDPASHALALGLVAAALVTAAAVPVRRALRVSPLEALRAP
jgi:putative ABC transport system permease protein